MNIFVTGATGFLGTALCARLRERGDRVVGVGSRDCDLTRDDSLAPYAREKFDQIYHLAAWTQAGDFCLRHPGEQWIRNQQINTHVLAWWARVQPQASLISMGTSCAYAPDLPLVEENYLSGLPIESLFSYAMTKRMLYAGLLSLSRQYGLTFLHLVPSTLYGPGYHTDGRQPHFIFDLIVKILRGRYLGEPVVLWGDGHQRRELVHIDDFVCAALRLADHVDNELVNVGEGAEHSIREFARLICDEVGFDFARIEFDETRYVGARSKCLAVEKLERLLPGFERTPLRDGLAATIAWCRSRPEIFLRPRVDAA
ncbi:MAG TPA: NAD-dependent epimerase/dehydratase family protein [Planctomycetaceae bacterium]|jgi:GDP-L-fucose synthase|nr:NAD-dependent epimerase/dehydratase family protein [Planctomycetaceae bacterium]